MIKDHSFLSAVVLNDRSNQSVTYNDSLYGPPALSGSIRPDVSWGQGVGGIVSAIKGLKSGSKRDYVKSMGTELWPCSAELSVDRQSRKEP